MGTLTPQSAAKIRDLRDPTPEAAELREILAKHIDKLAQLMRDSKVRAIDIHWTNDPMEGPPIGDAKTWLPSPFSNMYIAAEFEAKG